MTQTKTTETRPTNNKTTTDGLIPTLTPGASKSRTASCGGQGDRSSHADSAPPPPTHTHASRRGDHRSVGYVYSDEGDTATTAGAGHRGKGGLVKGLAARTAPASPVAGRPGKGTGKTALTSPRAAGGAHCRTETRSVQATGESHKDHMRRHGYHGDAHPNRSAKSSGTRPYTRAKNGTTAPPLRAAIHPLAASSTRDIYRESRVPRTSRLAS